MKRFFKYIMLLLFVAIIIIFLVLNNKVVIPDKVIIEDRGIYENSSGNFIEITDNGDVERIAKIIDKASVASSNIIMLNSRSKTKRSVYIEYSDFDIEFMVSYAKNRIDDSRLTIWSVPEGYRYYISSEDAIELVSLLEEYLE